MTSPYLVDGDRMLSPERIRICSYDSLQAGELFLHHSYGEGWQLAIMVHTQQNSKTLRIPVWLSAPSSSLIAPTYHVMDGIGSSVPSLGTQYEFVVDPFDPRNKMAHSPMSTDGPMLGLTDGRLVLRAVPTQGSLHYGSIVVDVRSGTILNANAQQPTLTFASWTLQLPLREGLDQTCQAWGF